MIIETSPFLRVSNLTRRLPRVDQQTVTLVFEDWIDPVGINVTEAATRPARVLWSTKRRAYCLLYPM